MWQEQDGKLVKKYKFPNYKAAWEFVNKVSEIAEKMNHHPDVEFGWGYVKLSIFTHSKGRITDRDHKLSQTIDKL